MTVQSSIVTHRLRDLDLRFERLRQRDDPTERILLDSIRLGGISTALIAINDDRSKQHPILIDGFKRYRCAARLGIESIPLQSIDADVKSGLLLFLSQSRRQGLTDLEFAGLIDYLRKNYAMTLSRIASFLGCSVAWVSLRHGMLEQMSQTVRDCIFSGKLPLRCWLYAIRPFTRVKGVDGSTIDRFIMAVAAKGLSTRQIFLLTRAYFTGSPLIRQNIENGCLQQVLQAIAGPSADDSISQHPSPQIIEELRQARCCIDRLIASLPQSKPADVTSVLEGNLIADAILRSLRSFSRIIKEYYDRTGQENGGAGDAPGGHAQTQNSSGTQHQCQNRTLDHCQSNC
jgi:hypothetical protein